MSCRVTFMRGTVIMEFPAKLLPPYQGDRASLLAVFLNGRATLVLTGHTCVFLDHHVPI